MKVESYNALNTFAVLTPDLSLLPAPATPSLYQDLAENFSNFVGHSLIAMHDFSSDWTSWERHPAGDELVVLLSGNATMVIELDIGQDIISLSEPGAYAIVPRDKWHTAKISEPSRMLFITPGEGTEHREMQAE